MSGYSGHGDAIGHAGELLQGAVRIKGQLAPFLVTFPAPDFRSEATAHSSRQWSVRPYWKTKALRAAQAASKRLRVREPLAIEIASEIPVGCGCGSSTADCVAAVRAVADWAGRQVHPEEIAAIVHEAELACDPTMFGDEPVAFLPRAGRVLRRFAGRWPAIDVKVVNLGGPPVDTEACPVPRYTEDELDEFEQLLQLTAAGFEAGDGAKLARVAIRSAEIHLRYRPNAALRELCEHSVEKGAWGVAIAHSGTIAVVLNKPVAVAEEADIVHFVSRRG